LDAGDSRSPSAGGTGRSTKGAHASHRDALKEKGRPASKSQGPTGRKGQACRKGQGLAPSQGESKTRTTAKSKSEGVRRKKAEGIPQGEGNGKAESKTRIQEKEGAFSGRNQKEKNESTTAQEEIRAIHETLARRSR
jgi:hypothetical protein